MSQFCSSCGAPHVSGSRFCRQCGSPRDDVSEAEAPTEVGRADAPLREEYTGPPMAATEPAFTPVEPVLPTSHDADDERTAVYPAQPGPLESSPPRRVDAPPIRVAAAPAAQAAQAGRGPAGPPHHASGGTGSGKRFGLIAGGVALLAAAAVGIVFLISGDSDTGRTSATSPRTPAVERSQPVEDDRLKPKVADPGSSAADGAGNGEEIELSSTSATGYDIDLPVGWSTVVDDESQDAPDGITRRRTELSDGDLLLIVDHLTGFDTPAEENRSDLAAGASEQYSGYKEIGLSEIDLPETTGFVWQYSHDDGGGRLRKVNVLFDLDGDSFAVLAVGKGDAATYDELLAIATRVAESIVVG